MKEGTPLRWVQLTGWPVAGLGQLDYEQVMGGRMGGLSVDRRSCCSAKGVDQRTELWRRSIGEGV
jgi:hypothetical protein